MITKQVTFKFDSDSTYESFRSMIFDGLDSFIIEGMEVEGGICDLDLVEDSDKEYIILIGFREEV